VSTLWIDERGSDVLGLPECRRLLALGAKQGRHGHLGFQDGNMPLVLPLDYAVDGPDLLVRIGEGLFARVRQAPLVAFQVDGTDRSRTWSVLVRGPAADEDSSWSGTPAPTPEVVSRGNRTVRIRAQVVSGRLLGVAGSG
jgi:uncharacterized protein